MGVKKEMRRHQGGREKEVLWRSSLSKTLVFNTVLPFLGHSLKEIIQRKGGKIYVHMYINCSFTCDNKELGINKMFRSRGVVE